MSEDMSDSVNEKPIPIDLVPFAEALGNSREFLRAWAKPDGGATSFYINPRSLGADPAWFGIAMVDAIRHAAAAWAQAIDRPEAEMFDRIMQGFQAERDAPTNDLPLPVAVARKDD